MVHYVPKPPSDPKEYPLTPSENTCDRAYDQIAEIFRTPLVGSYVWSYEEQDARIQKLYKLGRERNWDVDLHLDWSQAPMMSEAESPGAQGELNPYAGWSQYQALSHDDKRRFFWHSNAWTISQFLHGEQGALLVASQLVSCAPTYEAKLYASSQTFDEARHVDAFSRYLRTKVGLMYPVNWHLKALLDKCLTDERWDLKFIAIQLVIESLGLAAFRVKRETSSDPLLRQILELVLRDEARHVAFGIAFLEQHVKNLSQAERDERAVFALEACKVMRERIVPTDVYEHFRMDVTEGRRHFLEAGQIASFRNFLFTRIMPNLKRVGLLTECVLPEYERLGLAAFADLPSDGDIDWAAMSAPI